MLFLVKRVLVLVIVATLAVSLWKNPEATFSAFGDVISAVARLSHNLSDRVRAHQAQGG